jgi:hypothetical protein
VLVSAPVAVGAPYLPAANNPSDRVPQIPAIIWTGHGTDRIVDAQVLEQVDTPDHYYAGAYSE